MLNKTRCYKVLYYTMNLIFMKLFINSCIGNMLILPKEEAKVAEILEKNGYRINQSRLKPGKKIEIVEFNNNSRYKRGDLEAICNLQSLNALKFEGINFPELTTEELKSCAENSVNKLIFTKVIFDNESICKLVMRKKNIELELSFYKSKLSRNLIWCITENMLLTGFAHDGQLNISDDEFCAISKKAKNLKYLRINETDLDSKSLNCILNFPSLTGIMLQNWSKVSEQERHKMVDAYEKKYGRKIQRIIEDPTTNTY